MINSPRLSTSHTIHQISFGKASHISFNPLDGVKKQHGKIFFLKKKEEEKNKEK